MAEQTYDVLESVESTSQPFVGRWNQLVSTTNWEKGRIIQEWRTALIEADAPANEYSDEVWSRRVGGVTGQHVGRLRRVHERFGDVHQQYNGLYWSHFQAALDWEDAEMWLEGAIQNGWSVSQMRQKRWETLGAIQGQEPRDDDVVPTETDEDYVPVAEANVEPVLKAQMEEVVHQSQSTSKSEPAGDDKKTTAEVSSGRDADSRGAEIYADDEGQPTASFVRPFEHLAELPSDVHEAFESYKLAILRHKTVGWQEISLDDLLASLDALKELALAPSTDEKPF